MSSRLAALFRFVPVAFVDLTADFEAVFFFAMIKAFQRLILMTSVVTRPATARRNRHADFVRSFDGARLRLGCEICKRVARLRQNALKSFKVGTPTRALHGDAPDSGAGPHAVVAKLTLKESAIMDSLRELLIDELSDLYSAEKQLVAALPKMAKAATNANLKSAFLGHLAETKGQVERLDQIFEELEEKPKRKKCKAMEGLIEEGKEVIETNGVPEVKDAALIGAAQRVEHYEIAAYGTARGISETLSLSKVVKLLQKTLDEEGQADKKLNDLATSEVNSAALAASE